MKKILIISHAMEIGGVERSLLGLLDSIDYSRYSVDLFLLRHEGELLSLIPKEVKLLPEIPAYTVLARPMIKTIKEGHILLTSARLIGKVAANRFARKNGHMESAVAIEYSHRFTKCLMPEIQPDVEYDLAVSYLTPHYFVAEKVHAKRKIGWIHTDYSTLQIDRVSEKKMWSALDNIISISDAVTESFLKIFPRLKDKIVLIENILPSKLINLQANETVEPLCGDINLLSIGRFSSAKNFDNIPDICSRLCDMGLPIKWYIIGYGADEGLICQRIKEHKMENAVILLGKMENPYPYIKACDIYVQPSRYEGKCVSVREAQMLGKPVIITRYATSCSQLEDGVDGIIVPMDNQGCAEGIARVVQDTQLQNHLVENCRARDYSNSKEIEKLYEIFK